MSARSTLGGRFESWNKKDLITGYVAGDRVGNLFFAAHVLLAALITTMGIVQVVPRVRKRALALHRWNGRLYALDLFWGFGSFVLPVAVLEVYLRAKERGTPRARSAVAGLLFALAAMTGIGIVGAYLFMWRRYL